MPEKVKKRHLLDYSILLPYIVMCVTGLMMVYSSTSYVAMTATQPTTAASYVINQTLFWLVSLIAITVMYKMKTDVFRNKKFVQIAMIVILFLLIAAFFFPRRNGALGWLSIAGFSIQPAEYLKFIVIWFLSVTLSSANRNRFCLHRDHGTLSRLRECCNRYVAGICRVIV